MLDFVIDTGLYQFVDFATRASNILDILLADDQQIIASVTADAPVGLSDHIMVTFKIVLVVGMTCQTISSVTERPIYKWRLADFNAMHEYFSCVDWLSIVCKYPSALDMWDMFIDTIYTAVDLCVPKCKVTTTTTTLKRGHYPRVLRKLTCKKTQAVEKVQKQSTRPCYSRSISRLC